MLREPGVPDFQKKSSSQEINKALAENPLSFYFLPEVITMKKILLHIAVLIVFSLPAWAQDSSRTAVIQFEQTEMDSIVVVADSTAERVFHFKNSGTDTLKILALRPS